MDNEIQTIAFDELLAETDKAVKIRVDNLEVWLPLSKIEIQHDEHDKYIDLPLWLVESNGLEDYVLD